MSPRTNDRKLEHLRIVRRDGGVERRKNFFDDILLTHRALPEINLRDVDTSTVFLGKRLSFPLLISGMTGGRGAQLRRINIRLARAAEATGVAMGVGSQRVLFDDPEARASFALRPDAPTALLFANLGAIQLNHGFTLEHCREAVRALDADALVLHLNPLQEAIQPEGDTDFAGLAKKIGAVAAGLGKPVILKEVGAGLSIDDVRLAMRRGIRCFDVAGAGGTSWSRVEHHRRLRETGHDIGLTFQDWGLPTPEALRRLYPLRNKISVIASGGVRSGLDMAKAVILGASLCGIAAPLLKAAMESEAAAVEAIERLRREFAAAMFLLGAPDVRSLRGNIKLISSGIEGVEPS
jgi:isopentenyl-diphosphate Delta-isomerase